VSLSSTIEIIQAIDEHDNDDIDILCVARGGDNLAIFEDLAICESILDRETIIASAIGHAQDVSLFEKLADKKFITPTQFGHYLKDIYNNTIAEFEQSKAKLVQDITNQLAANYNKQISNLNEQLKSTKELHERTALENTKLHTEKIQVLAQQVNTLQQQQSQKDKLLEQANRINEDYQHQLSNKPNPIIWIIVGLIIGLILSLLFKK
jgi:exonuclease VII large subunit